MSSSHAHLPGHFARKDCPGVFGPLPGRKFCTPFIISHFSNFVKGKFFEHMFVHEPWTLVRGWRTCRPPGVDICPRGSYKAAAAAGTVRVAATNVYELQTFRFT